MTLCRSRRRSHRSRRRWRFRRSQLFVERARANARFAVDDPNVAPVVELCQRLDGLPLALELAAAQTSVLGIRDLLAGLDDRGSTMRSRRRDIPDRQRTMDAAVDWSLRLLTPAGAVGAAPAQLCCAPGSPSMPRS